MKKPTLNAVKFRLVLLVLMTIAIIVIVSVFVFGYRYMQSVGEETAKRQADASASEDSIGALQRLQVQLATLEGINEKLAGLRSTNDLPQFDTERSLRTITGQLGIGVRDITFIEGGGATTTSATAKPATAAASQASNSKISFQFDRPISYSEYLRFLDAIQTSTPKLIIDGASLPAGSTRGSVEPGTLTLELATK